MYRLKTVVKPLAAATLRTLSREGPDKTSAVLSPATNRRYVSQVAAESFLNGTSSSYVEEMYNAWLEDPKSVHKVKDILQHTC